MKYNLNARQSKDLLQQVEEITVFYKDINTLFNYEEWGLLDKEIILKIPESTSIDWDLIVAFNEKMNITLRLNDIHMTKEAKNRGIKFFWNYPATNYYDIQALIQLGVSKIVLDTPLTFELPTVRTIVPSEIELRMCANMAYGNYMIRKNGIRGSYVRPEDADYYGQWIDTLEFMVDTLTKEAALFKVYHNDKNWPGNLNILINRLDYDVDNRAIPEEFRINRCDCGQKCQKGKPCNSCELIFNYVNLVDKAKFDWDLETHSWKKNEEN